MKDHAVFCPLLLSLGLLAGCSSNAPSAGIDPAKRWTQAQLGSGEDVAAGLNARFADAPRQCPDGSSAYHCSGVLIRGVSVSDQYHSWNPSPGSVANDAVSFSYLRADVGTTVIFGAAAFIFKPSLATAVPPIDVRCEFPYDAGTSGNPQPCANSCEAKGVTTYEQWVAMYGQGGAVSCAFSPSREQFYLSIDVRRHNEAIRERFNEVLTQAWPLDIPLQLPLETFVYRTDWSIPGVALKQAQYLQCDYHAVTGEYMPVIAMDLKAADGKVFVFNPQDQTSPASPCIL